MLSKVSRPSRVGAAFGGVTGAGTVVDAFGGVGLVPGGAAAADTDPAVTVGVNVSLVGVAAEIGPVNMMASLTVDSAGEASRFAAVPPRGAGSIAAGGAFGEGLWG